MDIFTFGLTEPIYIDVETAMSLARAYMIQLVNAYPDIVYTAYSERNDISSKKPPVRHQGNPF